MKTLEMAGRFDLIGSTRENGHDIHFWRRLPDDDVLEFDTRSHGITRVGHVGEKSIWQRTVAGISFVNLVGADTMEQSLSRITDPDWKAFSKVELLGIAKNGNRDSYVIGLTLKNGQRQICYFDTQTHFLVRLDLAQHFGSGTHMASRTSKEEEAYKIEVHFSDYKEADGLRFPNVISFECGQCGVQIILNSVKVNQPIADEVFAAK